MSESTNMIINKLNTEILKRELKIATLERDILVGKQIMIRVLGDLFHGDIEVAKARIRKVCAVEECII